MTKNRADISDIIQRILEGKLKTIHELMKIGALTLQEVMEEFLECSSLEQLQILWEMLDTCKHDKTHKHCKCTLLGMALGAAAFSRHVSLDDDIAALAALLLFRARQQHAKVPAGRLRKLEKARTIAEYGLKDIEDHRREGFTWVTEHLGEVGRNAGYSPAKPLQRYHVTRTVRFFEKKFYNSTGPFRVPPQPRVLAKDEKQPPAIGKEKEILESSAGVLVKQLERLPLFRQCKFDELLRSRKHQQALTYVSLDSMGVIRDPDRDRLYEHSAYCLHELATEVIASHRIFSDAQNGPIRETRDFIWGALYGKRYPAPDASVYENKPETLVPAEGMNVDEPLTIVGISEGGGVLSYCSEGEMHEVVLPDTQGTVEKKGKEDRKLGDRINNLRDALRSLTDAPLVQFLYAPENPYIERQYVTNLVITLRDQRANFERRLKGDRRARRQFKSIMENSASKTRDASCNEDYVGPVIASVTSDEGFRRIVEENEFQCSTKARNRRIYLKPKYLPRLPDGTRLSFTKRSGLSYASRTCLKGLLRDTAKPPYHINHSAYVADLLHRGNPEDWAMVASRNLFALLGIDIIKPRGEECKQHAYLTSEDLPIVHIPHPHISLLFLREMIRKYNES